MVHPFLHFALHLNLCQPVYIIRCSFIVWRLSYKIVYLLGIKLHYLFFLVTIHNAPCQEFMMEHIILFPSISHIVLIVYGDIFIVWIYLFPSFVYRKEHRFNSGCGLGHETCCSGRCYCKKRNVSPSKALHLLEQILVCLAYSVNHRIVRFPRCIKNRESTPFFGHNCRRPVCFQCKSFLHFNRKFQCLICSVNESQSSKHVSLGSNAKTGSSSSKSFAFNLVPKIELCKFYLFFFGIRCNFCNNRLYFLHFKVNKVIHKAHCLPCMILK